MKKLFLVSLLLMLGALAFGQNIPPCDPNNSPNCTDYFGVANWAYSPLPAGTITGYTVVSAGSGYANPQVTITDPAGAPITTTATFDAVSGAITGITGGTGVAGYIAPQVTIVDVGTGGTLLSPNCGGVGQSACGSGAVVTAIIGGTLTGGIRKFVDTLTLPLANLPLGVPDTTTFPNSDFYVIGLMQYSTKMHTDLPNTTLRGYCQVINGVCAAGQPSYLGPLILASKNRPVRVLFKNMLPIGAGGNLFIPVDTTYMGAGSPYTQNRATLHLHGGATPWISDGTPHQWTAPAGEAGPPKGDSTQNVPDMWFDANGNVIANCAAQPTCAVAGATNDPGPGAMTFFWTNQQGGRLMFYHDHAYGITRLNVYVGEAAGYLLVDPTEEDALAAATVPGTLGAAGDLTHLVPLVIQDKTFVPSAAELGVEDPTWTAGGFGTSPGTANPGDLWFPHVYTPNQNPADVGGANAFGRWDYGPWTLPGNQTVLLAANPETAVTVPCTSSAFPNQAVNCPITPNPSGTPESFMDTPLVNGKAYPVLHVAPEAYRFQILSAGNDRSWNLQLYVADPLGYKNPVTGLPTEVKMVPAIQPAANSTVPLCTTLTPITNTTLFMGLATGLLDAKGNPINGTGLPLNCWPNFGAGSQTAGIPIQQTMWAADGRFGGAPDPTTAGPPFIQIGTEGGLLPAPVVIPSMPTGYEANTRSVTITNVSVHGLWLGPAERADAIVDFSAFNGKTLILYNDAPTPAPAVDSRLDYFTGDGDQTPIGGAPNTMPGYGPNTRTIMQIVVDQAPTGKPFSLPALTSALPSIFAQTQPVPIVPEPTYPPASGGYSAIPTYSLITDASLTFFPIGSTTPVTITDDRKTIQELFTLDYGRMNATLGVELPLTNFLTQTTIPLGYIDPPTEIIKEGDTQLWHITHNGVDTHFIHFHLFNVQVINRSAWDGTKRPPDQNELGWKDTVRMNPLEDILVALQPITPLPPFPVRDSYRLWDVTMMPGSDCPAPAPGVSPLPCSIFTDVNPANNNPLNTPNQFQNFGWEYVWHCHILGHEENDMMRAIAFNVPPEAPSSLTVSAATSGLNLSWTDNSASETGFTLQRDVTAAFAAPTTVTVGPSTPTDRNGQGITWGGPITYNDTTATAPPYFYRVQASKPQASYWTSGVITSAWSNTASFTAGTGAPFAGISPPALAFGTVALLATSAPQTLTLSNTGNAQFTYTITKLGPDAADFAVTATLCAGTVAANSSCTLSVTFSPTFGGAESAILSIGTNDPLNPTLTVSLTGTGGMPLLTITANSATMRYGSAVPAITFSYSPANPAGLTTPPTCLTTATKTSPVGTYPIACSGAVDPIYTITYMPGTVSVTPAPLTIWATNNAMAAGTTPPVITPLYVGLVAGDTAATFNTAPNVAPTCTTTATSTSPVGKYPSSCSGAIDPNYTISYANGTVTVAVGVLTITAPSFSMPYGGPIPTLTPAYSVNPPAPPFTPPTCSTSVGVRSGVGPYTGAVICSGAVDPNYAISYVAGDVTITAVPLTITPPSPTMQYGGPVPTLTPAYSGFVAGDSAANLTTQPTCTTTATAASPVSPPTYPVNCSGAVDANYTISYLNPGTLTIAKRAASVTASPATKVYGTADPMLTGTLAGFLASDGVTATFTRTAGETVAGSPYTISATLSSTVVGALANYTITSTSAAFTITRAPASVTPTATGKIWGQPDPALSGTLVGFVPADNVTATYSRTAGTSVGTYTISATLSPAALLPNYNITYNTAPFTISTAIQLAPGALTFAAQNLGTTSAVQTVILTNIGGAPLTTTSVTFTGLNPGDFNRAGGGGNCGATVAVGATCNINVRFRPTATGIRTASLSVTAAGFNTGTVTLTGTGAQPAATLTPASNDFGPVLRRTTSTPVPFTLSNPGTAPLTINNISLAGANPGQFTITLNTCVASLGAGANCTINVAFSPTRAGAFTATLRVNDNAPGSPQTATLTGTGQ